MQSSLATIGYEFNPSEHGIFVEIYLPKKAEFQGTLYQALTEGFDIDRVRQHFQEKRERIDAFLQGHYRCEGRLERMQQVFYGYSMYEVDGVYYDSKSKKTYEERNQVIRIMFKPDLEQAGRVLERDQVARLTKQFLRHAGPLEGLRQAHPEVFGGESAACAEAERFLLYLDNWKYDVALFVLGYVIFEICERIKELGVVKGKDAEQEILVTSFWNLTVNRIVRS